MYTIAVYYKQDGRTVHEVVNPDWRMPHHWAEEKAAELNRRYISLGRRYHAINVQDAEQLTAS